MSTIADLPVDDAGLLNYVRERLPAQDDPNYAEKLEAIATGAGVSVHTLLKIWNGETADPRVSTVEHLIRYFRGLEQQRAA